MDIHRCRFIPYNPQAINALAFSHPPSLSVGGKGVPTLRLAVGRANGDIEIWNPLRGTWFQETVLRGGKDRSVEGLAWTLDPPEPGSGDRKSPGRLRLFSIGYSTAVTEWDLEKGRPLRHSSGNYGEVWCLAAQPRWQAPRGKDSKLVPAEGEFTGQHLAAGCADGSIVLLSTADNDLKFLRIMRPSTKRPRVLSVTFQNRNTIVAGYADSSIRVFDVRNGQLLRTISLGKGPTGGSKELLVWSVKCLSDGTIVSGDSAGEVRFWDAKNYALIQRLQSHKADTLDVAVSADGETVISGGADRKTVVYKRKSGEKGDKPSRWTEVMHKRYHTHDVKTLAVYETKNISIIVSGGPDATPIVLPLREFGKEHHRTLPSLPQLPQIASSPVSRLVMSFWDREASIWRISRGPASLHDTPESPKHRLVGKVLIQGEENITSAVLSTDGKILAIATISSVKLFSVRRRKGDEKGNLRIQKLDVPSSLSEDGARIITVSPDSRWVCVVRPNNDIYLARLKHALSIPEKPHVMPQLLKLSRAARAPRVENITHGTLGDYERTIRCVVFSHDSKILASGDLSGSVDTWVLENVGKLSSNAPTKSSGVSASDDESSDDEDEHADLEGEYWRSVSGESSIPRLKAGLAFLSFRPPSPTQSNLVTNGTDDASYTAKGESRLLALTTEHQLVEFDASEGKLSEWSRRNPKAYLPVNFKGVKDRAMGCLWDMTEERERLWLYGTSWLWMFDLKRDFPSAEELKELAENHEDWNLLMPTSQNSSHKRKRELLDDEEHERKKSNSGAGDRIPLAQSNLYVDHKARQIVGEDASQGEWVSLAKERVRGGDDEDDDEDDDDEYTTTQDVRLARLRRNNREEHEANTPQKQLPASGKPTKNGPGHPDSPSQKQLVKAGEHKSQQGRRWWYTYKYRGILGIVPLNSPNHDTLEGEESSGLEVAVVERPMWDVDLGDRYVREYE